MRSLPTIQQEVVQEIAGFAQKHLYYRKYIREDLESAIWDHWKYGTLDFLYDPRGLIYAMRYNISPNGRTADVLDLAIRRDKRDFRLVKFIIARNWSRFPTLVEFKFCRSLKYPHREEKVYKLNTLFKKRD